MTRILIIGLGAMGGAMARELSQNTNYEILGYDVASQTCHAAITAGFITQSIDITDVDNLNVDLIILATPPHITQKLLLNMQTATLILDIASVKEPIMQAGRHLSHFVGGHPMVGTDKFGFSGHGSVSYQQRNFFLIGNDTDIQQIKKILAPLNSQFIVTTPKLHDQQVALTSDLPHLVAYALVQTLQESATSNTLAYLGNGFKDTTRIAQANGELWSDILAQNKTAVHQSLQAFITVLKMLDNNMMTNNATKLNQQLQAIQTFRRTF